MVPLSLYALDDELAQLEQEILDAEGVVDDEADARHGALLDARADKVEAYALLIRRFEASAEAVKAERQRLASAERAFERAATRLKERLCQSMLARGERECTTRIGRVRLQTASMRAVELLVELDALPEAYVRVRTEADLSALRDDLRCDDAERRARAEAVARLAEPTVYVRLGA